MPERLGYILIDEDGSHSKSKCEESLNAHQIKLLRDVNSSVYDVFQVLEAFECFRLNMVDFLNSVQATISVASERRAEVLSTPFWFLEVVTIFRQRVSNILYSFTALLDISARQISATFGKKSDELKVLKGIQNEEFDGSFGYRFFYKLRNYSTHCALPNLEVYVLRLSKDRDSVVKPELRVVINKRSLLNSSFKKWGPILTQDLSSEPNDILIGEALKELGASVNRILVFFISCYASSIQKSGKLLVAAGMVAAVPDKGKLVIWDGTRVTPQDHDGCRMLPVEEFCFCWRQLEALRL